MDPLPKGVSPDDLKATLADINGVAVAAKYKVGGWTLFGGYEYAVFSPPSDDYPGGFQSIGGYTVLPGAVNTTAYDNNKHLQVAWIGARYALLPNLDINGAYYIAHQNDYAPSTAKPGDAPQYSRRRPRRDAAGHAEQLLRGQSAGDFRFARLETLQAPRCLCGRHVFGRFRRHRERLHPQFELRADGGIAVRLLIWESLRTSDGAQARAKQNNWPGELHREWEHIYRVKQGRGESRHLSDPDSQEMVGELYRLKQGEDERERAGNPTAEELDKALARYYIEEARIEVLH